tara:strand:- start:1305 stop:2429 length:1125 start_codon:yes stop_codon:yes gene_type:complete
MPNFKPKNQKKLAVNKHSIATLDNKHDEKMKRFNHISEIELPKLKLEIKKIKRKIQKNKTIKIEDRLELEDRIKDLKQQIKTLKTQKRNYLLNNSDLIFDYFEKKKNLSDGKTSKKKILHSFFSKTDEKVDVKNTNDTIVQRYFNNIDNKIIDMKNYEINYEICPKCQGELVQVESEGILICKICSYQSKFLIEHEKPSYKEPPKEVCFYAYKRINHFREILAQFQAKETTQIPDEVIDNIKKQIKKERLTLKNMDNKRAKEILKKLGYNKYYEHIPFIKDKLGIKPPVMQPELEDKLCNLFMEIQKPYSKHCPDSRVNFLNYYYVLYKMCELLDKHTFLPYFPMLKDPVKRIEQDEIWKKICSELNWEFIPTL